MHNRTRDVSPPSLPDVTFFLSISRVDTYTSPSHFWSETRISLSYFGLLLLVSFDLNCVCILFALQLASGRLQLYKKIKAFLQSGRGPFYNLSMVKIIQDRYRKRLRRRRQKNALEALKRIMRFLRASSSVWKTKMKNKSADIIRTFLMSARDVGRIRSAISRFIHCVVKVMLGDKKKFSLDIT